MWASVTDVHNWPALIRKETCPRTPDAVGDFGGSAEYTMLPFNDYQIANLLAFFYGQWNKIGYGNRPEENISTGDWWHEIPTILGQALFRTDTRSVRANNGVEFILDVNEPGLWTIMVKKPGQEAEPWL